MFIVFASEPALIEYQEYKGELRAYQLYVELESIEPRALVYARSQVDRFLSSVNGSACALDPPDPDPITFRDILGEDLSYKGFLSSIDLDFKVSRTQGGGESSKAFGSYCRDGGISVDLMGEAAIEDGLTGIKGWRSIRSSGCQQTAYYKMRDALEWIESRLRVAVREASEELPNSTGFLRKLGQELGGLLSEFRACYPDLELRLSYEKDFYFEYGELRALINFKIILRDPQGLFIEGGEERKGFWCIRELVIFAGG
ncbi:MAG: hypothetical protein BA066_02280 [Candidatus Korarchaeota archaeon NZ13-K]|nr:MAG: hypothetical protein BA066_02280 [Candidatus Korarchaeota archaeon NZ13-K]